MKTLNLNVKSKENNVFSDVKVSQTVENESDFRIFLNLVDLYVEILANVENFLWSNTLKKFLYEIIKNSYKNPLISGFYKLVNAVLMASGAFQSADTDRYDAECFNLVLQYLWNTLDAITQYPQELQISCLQFILQAPESFIRRIVARAVPAFKISFALGLTNYEVATMALDALERWTKSLGSDCPRDFVGELVPCLELYLQSEESSVHLLQDIEETKRNVKRVTLLDDEKTVEAFQKRILLFFGSMDNDVMLKFIHRRSLNTGATWSKKNLLEYPMPFPDVELNIKLDSMLPRIIELALSSGDRKTRVAASEVLHTIVAFMLGRTRNLWLCDPDRFTSLYETLCPALLRLGCDTDDVIMQLYHPLMMQITHWLSSVYMLNSGATIHLVDSLFDGLTDETNSSLRDVSGIYLAEFVRWSIKQSTDKNLARCPTNIDLIVQRIINFALDPSSRKRVAAAIAFNHLYKILRENEEIVNIFWFEILYAFVKSLDGCKDTRIHDAIRHVERVLIEKSQLFNEESAGRRKPPEFGGAHVRLEDAAKWILTQCRSLDRNCRKICFDLFASVSRRVDGRGTAKSVLADYLRSEGVQSLNDIVVGDLDDKSLPVAANNLEILLRTLDLYVWLIREKLIDNEFLFTELNLRRNVVFNCIVNFVNGALLIADTVENHASLRLQEFVRLKSLRCEIIITLFDFIPVLLEVKRINDNYVPDYVFCEAFFSLVSVCIIRPRRVGFDSSNLQLTEELPTKLEALLNEAACSLPEKLMNLMRSVLSRDIKKFSSNLFQLDEILRNEVVVNEKSVRGLILLQKCGLLKSCPGCDDITSNASSKILKIFDILETENLGQAVCFCPETEVKNYLQRLVELLLTDYDVDTMKTVVQLLMNNSELHRSDLTVVTHGEYFLSLFKDAVIQGCLRDVEKTLNLLVESIQDNPDNVLRITEALVLYLQRNRADYQNTIDETIDHLLEKFAVLHRAVNNLEHRRNVFLNIYAVVVRLKRTPLDVIVRRNEIYRWILRELVTSNKFKYKIRLLRDFLLCLTNESSTSDENPELMAILYNLKNERRIVMSADDPSGTKAASPETIDCFQTLLKLLPITKSSVVFDAVMNFAMGAGKLLCEDKVAEYLKLYYTGISASSVLRSLELAYQRFMNTSITEDRCDALLYFLLPSLRNCSPQTMENFFERNTKEIYTTIMQNPTDNLDDRQRLFVSQIGCYNLVEIMFAKLPRDRIDCKDSPITQSTIGSTGATEKFSKTIFRRTLPVRQLRAIEGDNREIVRLVHCAAYNCCIAIVSMAKDEKYYLAVFGENRSKNQLIWESIVDTARHYELRQTSKEYPKERKKVVNIRKSVKDNNPEDHYSYIKSYDLATSTLSENICAYDLNAVNVMSRSESAAGHRDDETMSLMLEVDDLNDHECMAPICALLIHMLNNEISRPQNGPAAKVLPRWMAEFRRSMSSDHVNVRLFMLKIVLNTQAVFKPYADFFLEPIITTIYKSLKDGPLNYLITDALVMLVDWQDVAVPSKEKTEKLAQLLLIVLVERATVAPTKYIIRYNMSILEMIVDAWHNSLSIPSSFAHWMSQKEPVAVRLVLIFLTNRMAEKIAAMEDVWEYLRKLMVDWKGKEEPVLQTFEAVGLMLRHSESMENFEERKNRVTDIARSVFRGMQLTNPGRLVKCVDAMCKAYPELTEEFYSFVSSSRSRVERTNIVKCLQVFSLAIPKMSEEEIVKELNYMQVSALLENKVLSCEKKCLEITKQLVPLLGPLRFRPLVELISRYSEHEVLEYRSICYEVFTALYKKYSTDTSGILEVTEMMETSRRILLAGLLDPAESIQQSAMEFWTEITDLTNKCSERLLDILDTYTIGVEKNFLQITTLMLLQLTKKSPTYEKKMFDPLHSCSYHDHAISVSRRSRNFESRIPLFAPSVASRMNQRLTQFSYAMGTSTSRQRDAQENFMLRATETPHFEETFLGEASISAGGTDDPSEEGIFAIPKVPELSRNKVSRRFLANGSEASSTTRRKHAASRFAEQEYRREYLARKRSSVKLYRKYRIGEFPDIEISHATVLGPMQELVKKDPVICKSLIVSLIRSLIDCMATTSESDRYCAELSERLTKILRGRQRNGVVMSAIFEIMFNVDELEFPWEVVTEVARADGLFAQGALLTERSLIYRNDEAEPPAKRKKVENSPDRNGGVERWVELAGLYESMNEVDVVLSIFKGETFSEDLHVASAARAAAEWERAEEAYARAYESVSGVKIKRHCLQGTFECLSRLTKWKTLENVIETRLKPNYDTLLDPDDVESAWVAPWMFRVHTHRFLDRRGNNAFVSALESYIRNADRCRMLKELFGEETAVIVSDGRPDVSRDFLNGSCDKIREDWIRLSPLAVPLRSRAVVKLRGIHDIDSYLKTVESPDLAAGSRLLLNYWRNSVPSVRDDLLAWDSHLSYRSYFTANLIERLSAESQDGNDVSNDLRSVRAGQMLTLVECALNQRNRQLAKKYLLRVEPDLNACDQELSDKFDLSAVRLKFLNAEMIDEPEKSSKDYVAAWKKAHELLNGDFASTSSQVALREIISTMASSLGRIASERPEFFALLASRSTILRDVSSERIDIENPTDSLRHYSFTNLKNCCLIADEDGECHLRMAKYCYENMFTNSADPHLSREFVRATLRAMSCGSEGATHYFPCLLKEEFLSDKENQQIFRDESTRVETWRFLVWQTQLLSSLGTSIGSLVLPIVERMIAAYPNALVYSLRLTLDTKPQLRYDPAMQPLIELLADKHEFNKFLDAMQYVVQPELCLEYHLKELLRNLSRGRATVVDDLMRKVYPTPVGDQAPSMQGQLYRKTIASYKREIEEMVDLPVEDIGPRVSALLGRLRNSLNVREDKNRLKDYSPWLQKFVGREIEVPGQYTGKKKPMPRYHAKIVKIESVVKVMQSIRRPIRITIVANDAKNYRFLVKFGEDLRLDQRVEQIFDVMNETLKSDVACSQRRLSIDTYQVFPLSGSLGFIQWIDGTKTLMDYINFSLDEHKRRQHHRVRKEYEEWIAKAAPGKSSTAQYKEALKYPAREVQEKMNELTDKIGWDLLRRTFVLLSPSMESFMSLRQNFTTSYAAMSIAQWILGIGDRHLGNTLVSVESGRSLGIDFGSAFGGGVDQAVPELMPFRLTAQIRGLLKPFTENDLMGATMIHVLRALRNGRGPLLACLNVVAHEQLNWEEHVNKLSQDTLGEAVGKLRIYGFVVKHAFLL